MQVRYRAEVLPPNCSPPSGARASRPQRHRESGGTEGAGRMPALPEGWMNTARYCSSQWATGIPNDALSIWGTKAGRHYKGVTQNCIQGVSCPVWKETLYGSNFLLRYIVVRNSRGVRNAGQVTVQVCAVRYVRTSRPRLRRFFLSPNICHNSGSALPAIPGI